MIAQMDKQFGKTRVGTQSGQLKISYPPPLVPPFNTIPIVEIPSTP